MCEHDEERSGRPSVITDDLMQVVEIKIRENKRFTKPLFHWTFPTFLGRRCTQLWLKTSASRNCVLDVYRHAVERCFAPPR
ncbi:hypothetical protein TNCV_1515961 [Trichonephila clavipes]|nr:hypothetical protein TNCV_1515961 [Trichonephila clavipes]